MYCKKAEGDGKEFEGKAHLGSRVRTLLTPPSVLKN